MTRSTQRVVTSEAAFRERAELAIADGGREETGRQ
jgi:hypothetical protein